MRHKVELTNWRDAGYSGGMRTHRNLRIPDPPPDPRVPDLEQRCADVLTAMMFGTYGERVRGYAQVEVGRAWTQRRLADAPAILLAVHDKLTAHMLPVHVGHVAEQIVVHLLTGTDELKRARYDERYGKCPHGTHDKAECDG